MQNSQIIFGFIERFQLNGSKFFNDDKRTVKGVSAGALGFSFGLTFSEAAERQYGFRSKMSLLCDKLAQKGKGALNDNVLTFLNRATKVELGLISTNLIRVYYEKAFFFLASFSSRARTRKFLKIGCKGVEDGRKCLSYCMFAPLHPRRRKGVKGARVQGCNPAAQYSRQFTRKVPLYDAKVPLYDAKVPLYNAKVPLYDAKVPLYDNTLTPSHPHTLTPSHPHTLAPLRPTVYPPGLHPLHPLHPAPTRVQGCKRVEGKGLTCDSYTLAPKNKVFARAREEKTSINP